MREYPKAREWSDIPKSKGITLSEDLCLYIYLSTPERLIQYMAVNELKQKPKMSWILILEMASGAYLMSSSEEKSMKEQAREKARNHSIDLTLELQI